MSTGFTSTADTFILGGHLVKVAGSDRVTPCTAIDDDPIGTAWIDAAEGAGCSILPLPGVVHEVYASAAVSAGDVVEPSATPGKVQPITTGTRVGVALTSASGSPLRCKVLGGV